MDAPWYAAGLAFECQRCRQCCGGAPGYVWVNPDEIARLAVALHMSPAHFRAAYCRRALGRVSLRERPDGDCVLLSGAGCSVYHDRPVQCRTFPFWEEHLASPEAWARLAESCPGVNKGQLHGIDEITAALAGKTGTDQQKG